jgi:hypothetical protein
MRRALKLKVHATLVPLAGATEDFDDNTTKTTVNVQSPSPSFYLAYHKNQKKSLSYKQVFFK